MSATMLQARLTDEGAVAQALCWREQTKFVLFQIYSTFILSTLVHYSKPMLNNRHR